MKISNSEIRHKMDDYLYSSTQLLCRWLKENLPKVSSNWWEKCVVDYLSEDLLYVKELEKIDLSSLLNIAAANTENIYRCTLDVYKDIYTQIKILKSVKTARNRWAHLPTKFPDKSDILDDLSAISQFFCFMSATKDLNDIEGFICKIEWNGIESEDVKNDTFAETTVSVRINTKNYSDNSNKTVIKKENNTIQSNCKSIGRKENTGTKCNVDSALRPIHNSKPDDKSSEKKEEGLSSKMKAVPLHNKEYIVQSGEKKINLYADDNMPSSGLDISVSAKCATVKGIGTCSDSIIIIPSEYKGKHVTRIAQEAFYGCQCVKAIMIPDGVYYIGERAFANCTALSHIKIPQNLEHIGTDAFYGCDGLEGVHICDIASWCSIDFVVPCSNPVTFAKNIYLNGEILSDLIIPREVETVGDLAFYNCVSLQSITLSDGTISIGKSSFENCASLGTINFSNNLISIGSSAFQNCSSLKELTLPIGLDSIGSGAFCSCVSLVFVYIPESVSTFGTGAFSNCINLETIYYNAEAIDDKLMGPAVFGMTGHHKNGIKVTIGSRVTEIPSHLFDSTKDDGSDIPSDVTSNITEVVFDEDSICSSIGNYAFHACSRLKGIKIPGCVESIGDWAFAKTALTSIQIPEGVKTIGEGAFAECRELKSVDIPITVISIGVRSFMNCSSLDNVILPEGITTVSSFTFKSCTALTNILIPDFVDELEEGAFCDCSSLVDIKFPPNLFYIGKRAFFECRSLRSITIPENVCYIEEDAFSYCSSLETINYNAVAMESLHDISAFDFSGEKGKGIIVTIGACVTKIPDFLFATLFEPCDNTTLNIVKVIFEEGSVCTYIGEESFNGCYNLESINIPEGVKSIGKRAFGCTAIKSVNIPEGVASVEDRTFYRCSSLRSIFIPDTVFYIGAETFFRCESLSHIIVASADIEISDNAFEGCSSLSSCYFYGNDEEYDKFFRTSNINKFINMEMFIYSEEVPRNSGDYWHFVDGEPKLWNDKM